MTPFIETFSGVRFQPLAPVLSSIFIEDIAHALSNQCRFAGHTRVPYSVAEHSVRVCNLVEAWGADEAVQFWALLHDASEAYLVDIPSPLKESEFGVAYRAAEAKLMRAICYRFGLPPVMPEIVKVADSVLLATEARDLMPHKPEHWKDLMVRPLPERISPMLPRLAEERFLNLFQDIDVRRAA